MKSYTCTSGVIKSQIKPVSTEYANWLNTLEWGFYCTFTTDYQLSLKSSRRVMDRLFSFIKNYNDEVRLFWVAEPFAGSLSYHIHALVHISNTINNSNNFNILKEAWHTVSKSRNKRNYAVIKNYNKKLGANFYVSKYISKKNTDYDILN